MQPGYQLRLSGSTLNNKGTLNLNSATIAGSGLLNNKSGNLSGPGTITSAFLNSQGVVSVPVGTTEIVQDFTNSGVIQLSGFTADLDGGQITNSGSIRGNGLVSNAVINNGTIESTGGNLTLADSTQNNSGGLMSVDSGSSLVIAAGLAVNLGTINLTGGVFDNNSFALANSSQISGYGTLRTGGLTNSGRISLTGAVSTVNGPVTNATSGTVNVSYNPATFTGNVVNNGYFKITATTVTYAAAFTNNGTYLSDPASNYFASLAVGPTGLLQGGIGDEFFVTGPFRMRATLIWAARANWS